MKDEKKTMPIHITEDYGAGNGYKRFICTACDAIMVYQPGTSVKKWESQVAAFKAEHENCKA